MPLQFGGRPLTAEFKKAIELYGLPLGNDNLEKLLGGGLQQKTLTFMYGKDLGHLLNLLALRAVKFFGGKALFIDASNSADPYLIREETDIARKDSESTMRTLKSIQLARFFTCHQLTNFVAEALPKLLLAEEEKKKNNNKSRDEEAIRFIAVSGIDSVFSEEDTKPPETEQLQFLIAKTLHDIAKTSSSVLFVVASSKLPCRPLFAKSDVAMCFYRDSKTRKNMVELTKHYSRRGATTEV